LVYGEYGVANDWGADIAYVGGNIYAGAAPANGAASTTKTLSTEGINVIVMRSRPVLNSAPIEETNNVQSWQARRRSSIAAT
jgi:hypothetical protein